jgi:hypothetical protein
MEDGRIKVKINKSMYIIYSFLINIGIQFITSTFILLSFFISFCYSIKITFQTLIIS